MPETLKTRIRAMLDHYISLARFDSALTWIYGVRDGCHELGLNMELIIGTLYGYFTVTEVKYEGETIWRYEE